MRPHSNARAQGYSTRHSAWSRPIVRFGVNAVCVMPVKDHERIVAELKAEIVRLELVAMAAAESIKEKYKILDTQKRVIEMLLENWDGPLGMAVIQSKITAIEKGEA